MNAVLDAHAFSRRTTTIHFADLFVNPAVRELLPEQQFAMVARDNNNLCSLGIRQIWSSQNPTWGLELYNRCLEVTDAVVSNHTTGRPHNSPLGGSSIRGHIHMIGPGPIMYLSVKEAARTTKLRPWVMAPTRIVEDQ
jgi:hypothetical protein